MSLDTSPGRLGHRPGDRPVPGYRLEEFLGGGGFGEVWKATGPGKVKVAIKFLDLRALPGKLERRALERIREINHPNLVPIFGIWAINGQGQVVEDASSASFSVAETPTLAFDTLSEAAQQLVIAMGLGAKSLYARLQEAITQGGQGIPRDELLDYMEEAARGIDHLNKPVHDLGEGPVSIVHGDIKPQNMLLVGDAVQICDFSLARSTEDAQKTAMGGHCTPGYAAPELHLAKPCVTSDQYCLAMSYVEMRTGTLPIPPKTDLHSLFILKHEGRLDLATLAEPEADVIRRATDPDPQQRFSSCREMVSALREAIGGVPRTRRVPRPRLTKRFLRKHVWKLLVLLALLAGAGGGAYYLFREPPPPALSPVVRKLVEDDRFDEAFAIVTKVRSVETGSAEHDRLLDDLCGWWSARIEEVAEKEGDFAKAVRLWAMAPTVSDLQVQKEERWRYLCKHFARQADQLIEASQFEEAFALLDQANTLEVELPWKNDLRLACTRRLGDLWSRLTTRIQELAANDSYRAAWNTLDQLGPKHLRGESPANLLKELYGLWIARIRKLAAEGRFSDALEVLDQAPPAHTSQKQREEVLAEMRELLKKRVLQTASKDFVAGWSDLARTPGGLAGQTLRESLQGPLQAIWKEQFDGHVRQEKFEPAAALIEAPKPRPPWLSADEDRQKYLYDVRVQWSKQLSDRAKALFRGPAPPDPQAVQHLADSAAEFLRYPPELLGARLIRIRALMALKLHDTAWNELASASEDDQPRHQRLLLALRMIASYRSGQRSKPKLRELLQKYQATATPQDEKDDLWRLTAGELEQIRDIEVFLGEGGPRVNKAEEAIAALSGGSQIGKGLAMAAALAPSAPAAPLTISNNDAEGLCRALGRLAARPEATVEQITTAIGITRSIWDRVDSSDAAVAMAKLWERKIVQQVAAGEPPLPDAKDSAGFAAELAALESDWQRLPEAAKAGIQADYVSAWRCECLLVGRAARSPERDQAQRDAASLAQNQDGYVRYVRALARATGPAPVHWETVLEDLAQVFASPGGTELGQGRVNKAAAWAAQGMTDLRRKRLRSDLLGSPFATAEQAEQFYRVAQGAQAAKDLTQEQMHQLEVGLALAAICKTRPDFQPAKTIVRQLEDLDRKKEAKTLEEDRAALAVLYTYLTQLQASAPLTQLAPAEQSAVIQDARIFLDLFRKRHGERLTEQEAAQLDARILRPFQALAAQNKNHATDKSALADFYEAAADFIFAYKDAKWPSRDVNAWLEEMLSSAIEVLETRQPASADGQAQARRAGLVLKRAKLRIERPRTDLAQVITDADDIIKLAPDLPGGYGLLAYARLVQSRSCIDADRQLKDLTAAIDAGAKAVQRCRPTDAEAKAEYCLIVGSACVERANSTRDPTFEAQTKDLHAALQWAPAAAQLSPGQHDYPYLAQGNAYEDLAWLVEEESEKNYKKAIEQFQTAAVNRLLPAQAYCSMGRCYYRIINATFLEAEQLKALGLASREYAIAKCKDALQSALTLDPTLVEGQHLLAQVAQSEGRYDDADRAYDKARSLAQGQPVHAVYLTSWAEFPLNRSDRLDPAQLQAVVDEATRRIAELQQCRTVPPGSILDPAKEAVRLRGKVLCRQGQYAAARHLYDQALSGTVARSDFNLLLARAECQLILGASAGDVKLIDAAIRDADRAVTVGLLRDELAFAHGCAARARAEAYARAERQPPPGVNFEQKYFEPGVKDVREAARLAPRRWHGEGWFEAGVKLTTTKAVRTRLLTPDEEKQVLQWQQQRIHLANEQGSTQKVESLTKELEQIRTVLDRLRGKT